MRPVRKADNLPPFCAVVTKSGSLNFLEHSGPVQACNGTALSLLQSVWILRCLLLCTLGVQFCLYDRIWYLFSANGWQLWSVNLWKCRKETAIYKRRNNTQSNTKTQNTQYRKQTYKTRKQRKKNIKKNISRIISNWQIEVNNNDTPHCTEPTYSYITVYQWQYIAPQIISVVVWNSLWTRRFLTIEAPRSFETSRTIDAMTGRHIAENLNPRRHDCADLKSRKYRFQLYVPVTVHREQSVKKEYQQDATI